MKKWVEHIITTITVIALVLMGFYSVLIVRNIGYLISTLHNKIDIYEQYRQEELDKLGEMIYKMATLTIENDYSQLEIDGLQQIEIKNLTKFLTELGILTTENDERQLKLTGDIIEVIKGIQDNQFKIKKELKTKKRINLDNVEEIKKANVLLYNTTAGFDGSGSHIVIKDKHYILTCAHLVKDEEDFVWVVLDEGSWHPLGLVKINKSKDLALFEIFMVDNLPYLEISDEFPKEGSEVVIIGNPADLTDIITDGVIAKVKNKGYLFTNKIYFGNSGGAILYKGKIVGVVNKIGVHYQLPVIVNYGYGVRLEIIKEFLGGIK